jgi:DNA-binding GntR family transcriptional regulator
MENNKRKSMEQVIYEDLKNAILNREIAPGAQLVENIIAEKLKISRTPIRGALKRLASEGIVNIITNKGAFVIQPSIEKIIQIYEVRRELEIIAMKFAIDKINKQDIDRLRELVKEELKSYVEKDIERYLCVNKEFHMILANKSNNQFLIEFMEKIIDQSNAYLIFYDVLFYGHTKETRGLNEHKEIIDLVEQKNIKRLEEAFKKHIKGTMESLKVNKRTYKSLSEIF